MSFGELFMAATMRSWFAVFWNTGFVALYFVWNAAVPLHGRFDPYPYPFLCTMLTALSYLQGPIIMTMQWSNDQAQKRQEDIMRRQLLYQLHIMEALYVHLKGTPFLDRNEVDKA